MHLFIETVQKQVNKILIYILFNIAIKGKTSIVLKVR